MLRRSRRGKDLSELFSAPLNKMADLVDAAHPTGHTSLPQQEMPGLQRRHLPHGKCLFFASLCTRFRLGGGDFSTWEDGLWLPLGFLLCGPGCMPTPIRQVKALHQVLSTPSPAVWTIPDTQSGHRKQA